MRQLKPFEITASALRTFIIVGTHYFIARPLGLADSIFIDVEISHST
jgi:hypothetical protein